MKNLIKRGIPVVKNPDFPLLEKYKYRRTVRAYCYYNHEIYMTRLDGEDIFGVRNYLETPGGGVEEGEMIDDALARELEEEIGVKGNIIKSFGNIGIEYYQLGRIDVSEMFLFQITSFVPNHQTKKEKEMKMHIEKLTPDELLKTLKNLPEDNVLAQTVYLRDAYYLEKNFQEIKRIIEE